jgi:cold shock CspA family protein
MATKKVANKKKIGRIKYADPESGYGYILAKDAADASDTVLFDISDVAPNVELEPGSEVRFELDPTSKAPKATSVESAETAESAGSV